MNCGSPAEDFLGTTTSGNQIHRFTELLGHHHHHNVGHHQLHLEVSLHILQVLLQLCLDVVDIGCQAAQRALRMLTIGCDCDESAILEL